MNFRHDPKERLIRRLRENKSELFEKLRMVFSDDSSKEINQKIITSIDELITIIKKSTDKELVEKVKKALGYS